MGMVPGWDAESRRRTTWEAADPRAVTIDCDGGHCTNVCSSKQSRILAQVCEGATRNVGSMSQPGCCGEFGRYVFLFLGPPRGRVLNPAPVYLGWAVAQESSAKF